MKRSEIAIERGKRIRIARTMADMSRNALCEKYGINNRTLQGWETGEFKLTRKGARLLAEAFNKSGLSITDEWLLAEESLDVFATASDPQSPSIPHTTVVPGFLTSPPQISPIIIPIETDEFEPYLKKGGIVGASLHKPNDLHSFINQVCITLRGNRFIVEVFKENTDDPSLHLIGKVSLYWLPLI